MPSKLSVCDFLTDESGATAIEYGLIAGLMAVAVGAGVSLLQGRLFLMFQSVADAFVSANN